MTKLSKLLTGLAGGAAIISTVYTAPVFAHNTNDTAALEAPFTIDSATISGRPANGHIHKDRDIFRIHASNPVTSKDLKININTIEKPFTVESAKYGGRGISVSTYNKDDGKVLIQGNLPRDQHRKGDGNKISVTINIVK